MRTVKASHYGLTVIPLPNDEFDMGVDTGQVLEVVVEVGPCVCRRGPVLRVLEDELSDLGDKGSVSI
jgi:hypothetical protein